MSTNSPINQFEAEPSRFRYEPHGMIEAMQFAEAVVQSGLVPHIKRKEAAFAIIVTGAELGLTAMQALRSIYIVDGKPTLSADLMVGLVKRSPVCQWFRLVESTDDHATYETLRRGEPEPTKYGYSLKDAERAGLASRRSWKLYTAAMLRARCATALARAVYPDLVAGIYDPDELQHHASEPLPNASEPTSHGVLLDAERAPASIPHAPPSEFEHATPSIEHISSAHQPPPPADEHPPEPIPAEVLAHEPPPESPRVTDVTSRLKELTALLHAQGDMRAAAKFANQQMTEHGLFPNDEAAAAALRDAYKKLPTGGDAYENLARAWLGLDANA